MQGTRWIKDNGEGEDKKKSIQFSPSEKTEAIVLKVTKIFEDSSVFCLNATLQKRRLPSEFLLLHNKFVF